MKLPWRAILLQAPVLLETARRLYGATRSIGGGVVREAPFVDDSDAVQDSLIVLERRQEEQARHVANLTTQAEETAQALVRLRAQVRGALVAALCAAVLAIAAIAVALWRTG